MQEVAQVYVDTHSGSCLRLLSSISLFQVGNSQMQDVA